MADRKHDWPKLILTALVTLVAGVVVGRALPENPTRQAVKVAFPGGATLEMDVSKPDLDYEEMLTTLFARDFTREATQGWLAHHRIFSLDDADLAHALSRELCDSIPQEPITLRIRRAQECAEKPVAAALRSLVAQRLPPFHYVGRSVRVGIQNDPLHRPKDGHANVCTNGGLLGRMVELTDTAGTATLRVRASGGYPCTGYTRYPDVQLNGEAARRLFAATLQEYQDAVAVVVE